jgi:hypothetical protein
MKISPSPPIFDFAVNVATGIRRSLIPAFEASLWESNSAGAAGEKKRAGWKSKLHAKMAEPSVDGHGQNRPGTYYLAFETKKHAYIVGNL